MLHSMRKGAGGWLAKGMLVLLVASFALWGIGGDMLGSSVGSGVIEVGEQTISLGEFQRAYRNNVNIASQRMQRQLSAEQVRLLQIGQSTIVQLRDRMLLQERARQLNLDVDDKSVASEITDGPSFKGFDGSFDRNRFALVLQQNGYSEAEYIELLRGDIKRSQLMESIALPQGTAPAILSDTFFNYYYEQRSAKYIVLSDTDAGAAPAPTDAQLINFIKDNAANYTAPEYRAADYVVIKPEMFTKDVNVTDAEIQEEFNGRSSEFFVPERRNILQMIFEDEQKALDAATKLSGGADFAQVANEALQLTPADIDLGEVAKTDLLDELQEEVFTAPDGGVTIPVKTILGWHLVKIVGISPEDRKSLDDVKERLKTDVALRKAVDVVYDKQTELEDEFAGGASVTEAANAIGVPVLTLKLTDRNGLGVDEKPNQDLPGLPAFLTEIFASEVGDDVELKESVNSNYFAVSVVDIKPSALKDLADVRTAATTAWQAKWQHDENLKAAEGFLEKLKGGTTLEALAAEQKLDVKLSPSAARNAPIADLSADAIKKLFDIESNEFAVGSNAEGNGYVLFSVASLTSADKEKDKAGLDALTTQLSDGLQQDLALQYRTYLEKEIGVSVKENLLREYF
jgi:peptidyl-prolyl cis-trans isomerase D